MGIAEQKCFCNEPPDRSSPLDVSAAHPRRLHHSLMFSSLRGASRITALFCAVLQIALATPSSPPAVGTAAPGRFLDIFRPARTETAALSPDGKRLAYSFREEDRLYIVIVAVDDPSKLLSKILVGTDAVSTPAVQLGSGEETPMKIHRMGWATDNRLVFETNANFTAETNSDPDESIRVNVPGAIFAINADGSNMRTLATPADVATTVQPPLKSEFENDRILSVDQMSLLETSKLERETKDKTLTPMSRETMPNTPVFLNFMKAKPGSIRLRTSDLRHYQLYTADIHSGKLTPGRIEKADDDMSVLTDRQGHVGAVIRSRGKGVAFPRSYMVPKSASLTLGRWRTLDSISKTSLGFSLSPENYFGERSFPIGFDEDRNTLYYASNVGRDTYGVYGLNLKTGGKTGRTLESSKLDLVDSATAGFLLESPLVFDRYTQELVGLHHQDALHRTLWMRPDLQDVQAQLQETFPSRSVRIIDWDKSSDRFLARVYGPTDTGGFYIFERSSKKISEFVRSAPEKPGAYRSISQLFSLPNPAGGDLTGIVVIPEAVRQKPIPLIVVCAEDPWLRFPADFDPNFRALTEMGFAVVQINPRGVWGFGIKHRQSTGDSYDVVQVEDIIATIDGLSKALPILSTRHVAIMGHNRGGYLALRALQLRPDRFRCAIGINPTISLKTWLEESRWNSDIVLEKGIALKPPSQHQHVEADYRKWWNYRKASTITATRELRLRRELEELGRKVDRGSMAGSLTREFFGSKLIEQNPLLDDSISITRPVLLLPYRRHGEAAARQYSDARQLARLIERNQVPVTVRSIYDDYINGFPEARADVFRHIEDFLNLNIYSYKVNLGETQIGNDNPTPLDRSAH